MKYLTLYFREKCTVLLKSYHQKYPLRAGMDVAELRQKLFPDVDINIASLILNALKNNETIIIEESVAKLPDFNIRLSSEQEIIQSKIKKILLKAGYEAPSPDEIFASFTKKEQSDVIHVLESMKTSGELVVLTPQILWLRSIYDDAMNKLMEHFDVNDEITLAECRDILGTSRKYALAFLEYLDRNRITRKDGDIRRLIVG